VWGVLWRITGEQADWLDRTEGVGRGFYRRIAVEVAAGGERVSAFTYHSLRGRAGRKPSRRYLGLLLAGARQHGLPDPWVERLRGFELACDERVPPRRRQRVPPRREERAPAHGRRLPARPLDAGNGPLGSEPPTDGRLVTLASMSRRVHELMNPDVVCVEPGLRAGDALKRLLDRDVVDAPVVSEDGRIIGIVSQAALMRHVEKPATASETGRFFTDDEDYRDLGDTPDHHTETPVEKIMSTKMHPVTRETGVAVAANIMRERRLHRLFVTDHGKLIGVITSLDLLRIVEELG
jgi:CBS domain-containing protein